MTTLSRRSDLVVRQGDRQHPGPCRAQARRFQERREGRLRGCRRQRKIENHTAIDPFQCRPTSHVAVLHSNHVNTGVQSPQRVNHRGIPSRAIPSQAPAANLANDVGIHRAENDELFFLND
jgi:hypothetical protein